MPIDKAAFLSSFLTIVVGGLAFAREPLEEGVARLLDLQVENDPRFSEEECPGCAAAPEGAAHRAAGEQGSVDQPGAGALAGEPAQVLGAGAAASPAPAPGARPQSAGESAPGSSGRRRKTPESEPDRQERRECRPSETTYCSVYTGDCIISGSRRCSSEGKWKSCEGRCTRTKYRSESATCCERKTERKFDYYSKKYVSVEYDNHYRCSVSCTDTIECKADDDERPSSSSSSPSLYDRSTCRVARTSCDAPRRYGCW